MDSMSIDLFPDAEIKDCVTAEATRELNEHQLALIGGGSGIVVVQ